MLRILFFYIFILTYIIFIILYQSSFWYMVHEMIKRDFLSKFCLKQRDRQENLKK